MYSTIAVVRLEKYKDYTAWISPYMAGTLNVSSRIHIILTNKTTTQEAIFPSGEAAAARQASKAGSLSDALSGQVVVGHVFSSTTPAGRACPSRLRPVQGSDQ